MYPLSVCDALLDPLQSAQESVICENTQTSQERQNNKTLIIIYSPKLSPLPEECSWSIYKIIKIHCDN